MIIKSAGLTWTPRASQLIGAQRRELQKDVDQLIINEMEPYVPKRTGRLSKSVTNGSVLGSGLLVFAVPYAHRQYTWENRRIIVGKRDSYWFDRMKKAKLDKLNRQVKKYVKELDRDR